MFLLDPTKVAGDVPGSAQQLHGILEKNKAEILASRPWDERRLAYPIKKNGVSHKKGLYYLTYFKADSQKLIEIERDFSLHEPLLRSMVLKIDPKLVDTMLALARDEHALALQVATTEETEEGGGEEGGEEHRGPRRPRRPPADSEDER
jgi:small subunit ribosomal protein S6